MKKRLILLTAGLSLVFEMNAQKLYVPGGTIGTSDNNNIGIGTTTPGSSLEIQNLVDQYQLRLGTGQWYYDLGRVQANGYLSIQGNQVGSNDILLAPTSGKVGIGTISPEVPLTVYGVSNFYPHRTGPGDARLFSINYTLSSPRFISNDYPIVLSTGGGNQPLILDAARIGIGTTNPGSSLEIQNLVDQYQLRLGTGSWYYDMGRVQAGGYLSIQGNQVGANNIALAPTSGNIGIGTTDPGNYKLNVWGSIRAHAVVVNITGADFVFEPTYKLRPLAEVETFIKQNKHLPNVAPAAEMQTNGVSMGEMQAKLLEKVEELTLYVIEKDKEIATLKAEKDSQLVQQAKKDAELKQEIKELRELILQK